MRKFIKIINCGLFATALLSSGIANAFTGSETHDLTLTGSVKGRECKANVPATIVFDSKLNSDAIPFAKDIQMDGNFPSHAIEYEIDFTNCTDKLAQLTIMGTPDEVDSTLLANSQAENAASNVAVAFLYTTGPLFPINTTMADPVFIGDPVTPENQVTGKIIVRVLVVKPEDKPATAGVYSSVAQMKIDYL
jgi:type 1 fimbria pilin